MIDLRKNLKKTLILLLLFSVEGARAAPAANEADKLIDRGVDLREQGKDQEALELFQKAYAQGKSPRALAQIGLAEQALGRWVEAEASLERALGEKKDKWIDARRGALESSLLKVREHIGRVEILGSAGANVSINGKMVGTLPLEKPVKVVAGTISVELSREDALPVTRSVNVLPGALARETIELVPKKKSEPQKVAALETPPPPPPSESRNEVIGVQTSSARGGGGVSLSTVAVITGAAAIAAAGTGTAFLFVRNSHVSKYNDDSVCLAGGRTRDENCKAEIDSAGSAGTIMAIGFIGGAVLAGATAALFMFDSGEPQAAAMESRPGADRAPISVRVGIAPEGIGAMISGAF